MNPTVTRNERMVPMVSMVEAWLQDVKLQAPSLLHRYLDAHGLQELPHPRYVNGDMAVMWERQPDGSYAETVRNAMPSGIVTAMEKGLLLAPPQPKQQVDVEPTVDAPDESGEMAQEAESQNELMVCAICKREYTNTVWYRKHMDKHDRRN